MMVAGAVVYTGAAVAVEEAEVQVQRDRSKAHIVQYPEYKYYNKTIS